MSVACAWFSNIVEKIGEIKFAIDKFLSAKASKAIEASHPYIPLWFRRNFVHGPDMFFEHKVPKFIRRYTGFSIDDPFDYEFPEMLTELRDQSYSQAVQSIQRIKDYWRSKRIKAWHGRECVTGLPTETITSIFELVDYDTLLDLRLTCRVFHNIATPIKLQGRIVLVPCRSRFIEVQRLLQNPTVALSIHTIEYGLLDPTGVIRQTSRWKLHNRRYSGRNETSRQKRWRSQFQQVIDESLPVLQNEDITDTDEEVQLFSDVLALLPNLRKLIISFPEFEYSARYFPYKKRDSQDLKCFHSMICFYDRLLSHFTTTRGFPNYVMDYECLESDVEEQHVIYRTSSVRRAIERSLVPLKAAGESSRSIEGLEFRKVPQVVSDGPVVDLQVPAEVRRACSSLKNLLITFSTGGEFASYTHVTHIPRLWQQIIHGAHGLHELKMRTEAVYNFWSYQIRLENRFPMSLRTRLKHLSLNEFSVIERQLSRFLEGCASSLRSLELSHIFLIGNNTHQPNTKGSWISIIKTLRDKLRLEHIRFWGMLSASKSHELWYICGGSKPVSRLEAVPDPKDSNKDDTWWDEVTVYRHTLFKVDESRDFKCLDCPAPLSMASAAIVQSEDCLEQRINRYITHRTDVYPPELQEFEELTARVDPRTQNWNEDDAFRVGYVGDHSWQMNVVVWQRPN